MENNFIRLFACVSFDTFLFYILSISVAMPTYSASNAEGYLLLKLQGVEGCFTSTNKAETATIIDQLSLECVSLSPPDFDKAQNSEQDIWLVLHVGTLEMVITPMQVVKHSRSTRTFVIESNGGQNALKLKFRNPQSLSEEEDLETFEVVLMQYAVVEEFEDLPPDYSPCPGGDPAFLKRPVPPPPVSPSLNIKLKVPPPLPPRPLLRGTLEIETGVDAKGKLVLVDEDDGEIIGTLGEEFRINADSNLAAKGHENDPVMVDLQSSENDQLAEVYIRAIPLEEQDYLMKTTTFIRCECYFIFFEKKKIRIFTGISFQSWYCSCHCRIKFRHILGYLLLYKPVNTVIPTSCLF